MHPSFGPKDYTELELESVRSDEGVAPTFRAPPKHWEICRVSFSAAVITLFRLPQCSYLIF